MTIVEAIVALYEQRGQASYGEGVNMIEHALQSGWLARHAGADDCLVVAALLHDIGHLLHDLPEDIAEAGVDTGHEMLASAWLSQHFPVEVSEPVRLHVDAKRYLCAVEPGYEDSLSDASRLSLKLQGGRFQPDDARAFGARPHASEAVKLRRWDDEAKVVGLASPGFANFRAAMAGALKRKSGAS
jgi:[1-hydroxy-2-(trimethylamino)ethyl]phosphonate dioxygenase